MMNTKLEASYHAQKYTGRRIPNNNTGAAMDSNVTAASFCQQTDHDRLAGKSHVRAGAFKLRGNTGT